jgi:hypothetical protein
MTSSMIIDDSQAREIATKFLGQHYSIVGIEDAILENNIWKVVVKVSSFGVRIKTVLISAKTGTIHEYF